MEQIFSDDINLVVGAGFSGAVIARLIAENLDEKVLVIDCKDHIAGHSFDYLQDGILIHKYGSHIFHTESEKVWDFISRFTTFNIYMHKVLALIDGQEVSVPFNLKTLHKLLPITLAKRLEIKLLKEFSYNTKVPILEFQKSKDEDLNFLFRFIYEKIFLNYTTKQWGSIPESIDKSITARVPVHISLDERYFQDKFQGIPMLGYAQTIKNILDHKSIEVRLNTGYSKDFRYKRLFFTGSIDEFFDYKFGVLPYRSLDFKLETHDTEFYQTNSVINYPNNYSFTRIHEYKHYLNTKTSKTIIAKEYPKDFKLGSSQRFYPVACKENTTLYNTYLDEAKKLSNTYFLGRLGDYKYYDMDKAIERAFDVFEEVKKES
ncbi:UDP-galactopyranose mutase [Helicobacter sp. 11S02629-2]|uniref:UDP-galactopyranose mutase n=1 Tax=Helicobacter sp. 11S02629-2 TaxID=1476195 RepID=UPI000BA7117F|nr:UDP-galactopyranose mutase [Helicobacter sp. 11S02629-2]PAF45323.1 UDP-galactopyranose mutase [Helicobacter sp. 11S02629-2]